MSDPAQVAKELIHCITHGSDGQVIPDRTKPRLQQAIAAALTTFAAQQVEEAVKEANKKADHWHQRMLVAQSQLAQFHAHPGGD